MEQRILYFDIINGISADMILATLLNLGIPEEIFLKELSKLNLDDEFDIKISSKFENGIKGTNVDVIINEKNIHRHLVDIFSIIDNSSLNDNVKDISKKVFMVIGEAEAKVHGTTIDKIHFHEVGAIDSIIDIVGTSILIDLLCIDKIYASTVPVGCGFVNCNHGIIPVPASSTLEILKDIPIKLNSVKGECTTPTGAAILKVLCDEFIDTLEFEPKQIGYGIGDKTFGVRYNIYNREELNRKFEIIDTKYVKVKVKLGYYKNNLIKVTPEYDECKIIAKNYNIRLNEVFFEINCIIKQKISSKSLT